MPSARPNILYFVVHDLGHHLPIYGADVDAPNIEKFAADGVIFDNCFCGSTPCSPSRGVAMTGRYAHSNGLMGLVNKGWSMPLEEQTIVDYLNEAGYETVQTGFQHERKNEEDNRYTVRIRKHPGAGFKLVENVVDNAIEYLRGRDESSAPFYLNLGTQEVHASLWMEHGGYSALERPAKAYGIDSPEAVSVPPHMPDNPKSRDLLSRFQACIRYTDAEFGRLMQAIDELGYRDNTIVVFTTDHGMVASRAKSTLYETGLEIATILRYPGVVSGGKRYEEILGNIDFVPTLLEATGLPVPEAVQGRSFWPLVTGRDYTPNEAVFAERSYHERYDPIRSVRTQDYHYIRNLDPEARRYLIPGEILALEDETMRVGLPNSMIHSTDPEVLERLPKRAEEELYDIAADPLEFKNLAGDPRYGDVLADMRARCETWMRETSDPVLEGPVPDGLNH